MLYLESSFCLLTQNSFNLQADDLCILGLMAFNQQDEK